MNCRTQNLDVYLIIQVSVIMFVFLVYDLSVFLFVCTPLYRVKCKLH